MAFVRRITVFVLLNILVIASITFILRITGLDRALYAYGANYQMLLVFCLVWGTGGAFISLLMSKFFAKHAMGVQIIDPSTRDPETRNLVNKVHDLARKVGITKMPEVGIYESPEINAFATGPSKNNSLVAVSTGLLQRMGGDEVEGVLGHEVSHIANGDMVTMTLVQGVVNAFVMFFAKIVAQTMAKDSEGRINYGMYYLLEMVFQMAFMFLAIPLITAVSRWREYRADYGSAKIAGKYKMISALRALQGTQKVLDNREPSFAAFKISGKKSSGLMKFFMTHPPLEDRIHALEQARI